VWAWFKQTQGRYRLADAGVTHLYVSLVGASLHGYRVETSDSGFLGSQVADAPFSSNTFERAGNRSVAHFPLDERIFVY
jgi:hypothetical protein